jgi:PEP-CTERM motif-containing protein
MKLRNLVLLPAAAAAIAFGTSAIANSLTFQGVTFETQALDSDTLRLSILNATSATGDWTGVDFLKAFEIKDIGNVTGANITSGPAGTYTQTVDAGLAATLGCTTGGTNGACFSATSPIALTDSMIWTIDFVGTLDFSAPHLKVQFLTGADATDKTGSLLSQAIPAIPEPETYAMMLVGFSLLGFVARRRKQSLGNVVPA